MYRILIVDDERIEREGIRHLIRKHNLELDIMTAENGEAALEVVRQQPVDIIITDIKMPFMDGLELSEKVSSLNPDIEMIIYSAYSDFEFARRAMRTNVTNYLLKPIQIPEFLAAIQTVIAKCQAKEEARSQASELLEGYNRGLVYEREKQLMDALNGTYSAEGEEVSSHSFIHLMLVDCGGRYFDNAEFVALLREPIRYTYDYLSLNEHQSVFFLNSREPISKQEQLELAEAMIAQASTVYPARIGIVIGRTVNHLGQLLDVFNEMEQTLELKFFMDGNPIMFTEDAPSEQSSADESEIESIRKQVYDYIDRADVQGAQYSIEMLFSTLRSRGKLSVIYTKFICSEVMKHAYAKADKQRVEDIAVYLDQIFNINSLTELKSLVSAIIERLIPAQEEAKEESASKLITSIKRLIDKDYSQDLSLESIAEHVHLTPSYLSFLFKKETGKSLVRYITQVRMEKAVELLTNTNMKIIDISETLGFSNSSYFIQIFRNFHGVSPAKYRESTS
ncbi:AraC family two component transcriptional regulator [Paenibacillus taihuensis]|uniref:AraC family two component transcriptional regulator n=1 Tax=Paenibacillus taihuensis TaxID=1156355 RepID=A0A3D9RM64_9BACL|nr:response regulator [Paenibacillus taihuensis]REE80973.1 AraC family two component transcriptional regulator [Paenibacillus taihuensis]